MILLTLYKDPEGKRENREFALLQEAIEFGQKTGSDYEIFDPHTGKVIDWNEVNVKEDDEWYYDDNEYLWKKLRADDGFYNGVTLHENPYGFMNIPASHGRASGNKSVLSHRTGN